MSTTRRVCVALAASAMMALTACTGGTGTPGSSPNSVALVGPDATPTVVPDGSAAALSVGVSEALVTSSPVVVLAEPTTAADGLEAATDLGVPLLMLDSPDNDSGTTTLVTSEIARLQAKSVVALGPDAEAAAETIDGVDVVTSVRRAGRVTAAAKATSTALLTVTPVPASTSETKSEANSEANAGANAGDANAPAQVDPLAVASTGTAQAIGATVVSTPLGDARQSAESVSALSKAKPSRVVAVGSAFGSSEQVAMQVGAASTGVQLPGGGQLISGKVYIALYGHPGSRALGLLGEQDLDTTVQRSRSQAEPYEEFTDATVVPTFEIITTVATGGAGDDGNFSQEVDPETLRPWIERAQREGIYVILDLQPGTSDTLEQAKRYESLLTYPNVGLAIDPEWKLKPGQRPLSQIGQMDVAEVNSVITWLAELTKAHNLPQKALVVHQFQLRMIQDRDQLDTSHRELQIIVHVDGNGTPGAKRDTYGALTEPAPAGVLWGWKNFIDEDSPMFTPERTMQVTPTPTMVSYQ